MNDSVKSAIDCADPRPRARGEPRAIVPAAVLDSLVKSLEANDDRRRPIDLPTGRWIRARPTPLANGALFGLLTFEDMQCRTVSLFSKERMTPAASFTLYWLYAVQDVETGEVTWAPIPKPHPSHKITALQASAIEFIAAARSGIARAELVANEYIVSQRADDDPYAPPLNVNDNELVNHVLRQRWFAHRRGPKPGMTLLDRFLVKVDRSDPDGHWLWTGAASNGIPMLRTNGRPYTAASIAWQLFNGPVPPGKFVHRTCGRRKCVNPEHLRLVDQRNQ